jgi:uncharacterized protein RhaS with RHS repeats
MVIDQDDYSARYYDPAYGRFTTMDPLAEKYYSISPYAYCGNNPVNAIDLDGRDIVFITISDRYTYTTQGNITDIKTEQTYAGSVQNWTSWKNHRWIY